MNTTLYVIIAVLAGYLVTCILQWRKLNRYEDQQPE